MSYTNRHRRIIPGWEGWAVAAILGVMWIALAIMVIFASPKAHSASRTIDPTNLDSMAQTYHCGDWFHGHKVRGYLVQVKYVPPVYSHFRADEIPAETLVRWIQSGLFIEKCQK